jgi:hypothetical protein
MGAMPTDGMKEEARRYLPAMRWISKRRASVLVKKGIHRLGGWHGQPGEVIQVKHGVMHLWPGWTLIAN